MLRCASSGYRSRSAWSLSSDRRPKGRIACPESYIVWAANIPLHLQVDALPCWTLPPKTWCVERQPRSRIPGSAAVTTRIWAHVDRCLACIVGISSAATALCIHMKQDIWRDARVARNTFEALTSVTKIIALVSDTTFPNLKQAHKVAQVGVSCQ